MDYKFIESLVEKYYTGDCTPEEKQLLALWFEQLPEKSVHMDSDQLSRLAQDIKHRIDIQTAPKPIKVLWYKIAAAVCICCALTAIVYNQLKTKDTLSTNRNMGVIQPIVPGSDRAILTFSDGRTVDISSIKDSMDFGGGIRIKKNSAGELTYIVEDNENAANGVNTITTPRGGRYAINLSDGTKVSLNSASSLRFPTTLNRQNRREVVLTGEGYFDVKKDASKPFIVHVYDNSIHVIGTSFNINSYHPTEILTTLITGKVNVNDQVNLSPGQQAAIVNNKITVRKVDTDDYMDWKNNLFIFRNESLKPILERISNWYDIDFKIDSGVDTKITFTGSMSRYANVEEVLTFLSGTSSLKFTIHNRTIQVSN